MIFFDRLITISIASITTIPIRFKENKSLHDQDYLFQSQHNQHLNHKNDARAHIVNANFAFIEIQNVINHSMIIVNKTRFDSLVDYEKKDCYIIDTTNVSFVVGLR